jgi:hypothetical protein
VRVDSQSESVTPAGEETSQADSAEIKTAFWLLLYAVVPGVATHPDHLRFFALRSPSAKSQSFSRCPEMLF